jgi:hypothetical protein
MIHKSAFQCQWQSLFPAWRQINPLAIFLILIIFIIVVIIDAFMNANDENIWRLSHERFFINRQRSRARRAVNVAEVQGFRDRENVFRMFSNIFFLNNGKTLFFT